MNATPEIGTTRRERARSQRRRGSRVLVISLLAVLILGFLGAKMVTAIDGETAPQQPIIPSDDDKQDNPPVVVDKPEPVKRFNVLVLGVDERPGDIGRSDVMVLVSISEQGQPVFISIPRDTRVKIPGYGYEKVNHAYVYGGPKLAAQVVSDLLNLPVDGYVAVNLDAFESIVDALGGVTMEVEQRMYYEDPEQDLVIDLQPGQQRLNGEKAMQYVRYRADGRGDLGRVERQQKFLKALAKEAMSAKNIIRLPGVAKAVFNNVQTDMSLAEVLKVLNVAIKTYDQGVIGTALPGYADYIDDISYFLPDQEALDGLITEVLCN